MPRNRDDDYEDPVERDPDARNRPGPQPTTPSGYHDPVFVGYAADGKAIYEQQGTLIYGGSGNWSPWFGDRSELSPTQDRAGTKPPQTTTPPPGGSGGGSAPSPFTAPGPFQAPAMLNLGGPSGLSYIPPQPQFNVPRYEKPPAFSYDKFNAPTAESIFNDPGYQVREERGRNAMETAASARGVLNDSGTLKSLIDYGQNSASQEYQNVWNRDFNAWNTGFNNALNAYATNYGTQYADPYKAEYQGYMDTVVNPTMQSWQTLASAGQHQNDMNYLNAWNSYVQDEDIFRDRRNTALNWWGQ